MSVNKFIPHAYIIPEDRADEQIANGFINHDQVLQRQIQVLPCVTGWCSVRDKFQAEYIPYLRTYKEGHVVMLIDFDGHYASRRLEFEQVVPADLKKRVFVVGAKQGPEDLKRELGKNFEQIGLSLADECFSGTEATWSHEHLKHNNPDRLRLVSAVRPILFGP
ncbi:MAG TPA: hypothetical protein VG269_20700 [Tepidisphaeraceae bacterium]|jgi:hypothetical protein|nr:hypothetical protein [Tepidisphaeraceae bacterium]